MFFSLIVVSHFMFFLLFSFPLSKEGKNKLKRYIRIVNRLLFPPGEMFHALLCYVYNVVSVLF